MCVLRASSAASESELGTRAAPLRALQPTTIPTTPPPSWGIFRPRTSSTTSSAMSFRKLPTLQKWRVPVAALYSITFAFASCNYPPQRRGAGCWLAVARGGFGSHSLARLLRRGANLAGLPQPRAVVGKTISRCRHSCDWYVCHGAVPFALAQQTSTFLTIPPYHRHCRRHRRQHRHRTSLPLIIKPSPTPYTNAPLPRSLPYLTLPYTGLPLHGLCRT